MAGFDPEKMMSNLTTLVESLAGQRNMIDSSSLYNRPGGPGIARPGNHRPTGGVRTAAMYDSEHQSSFINAAVMSDTRAATMTSRLGRSVLGMDEKQTAQWRTTANAKATQDVLSSVMNSPTMSPFFGGSTASMAQGVATAMQGGGMRIGGSKTLMGSHVLAEQFAQDTRKSMQSHFSTASGMVDTKRSSGFDFTDLGMITEGMTRRGDFAGMDAGKAAKDIPKKVEEMASGLAEVADAFGDIPADQLIKISEDLMGSDISKNGARLKSAMQGLKAEAATLGRGDLNIEAYSKMIGGIADNLESTYGMTGEQKRSTARQIARDSVSAHDEYQQRRNQAAEKGIYLKEMSMQDTVDAQEFSQAAIMKETQTGAISRLIRQDYGDSMTDEQKAAMEKHINILETSGNAEERLASEDALKALGQSITGVSSDAFQEGRGGARGVNDSLSEAETKGRASNTGKGMVNRVLENYVDRGAVSGASREEISKFITDMSPEEQAAFIEANKGTRKGGFFKGMMSDTAGLTSSKATLESEALNRSVELRAQAMDTFRKGNPMVDFIAGMNGEDPQNNVNAMQWAMDTGRGTVLDMNEDGSLKNVTDEQAKYIADNFPAMAASAKQKGMSTKEYMQTAYGVEQLMGIAASGEGMLAHGEIDGKGQKLAFGTKADQSAYEANLVQQVNADEATKQKYADKVLKDADAEYANQDKLGAKKKSWFSGKEIDEKSISDSAVEQAAAADGAAKKEDAGFAKGGSGDYIGTLYLKGDQQVVEVYKTRQGTSK